jgi:hypothetical protein
MRDYRYGAEGCYDVSVIDGGTGGTSGKLSAAEMVGKRVKRGPDWKVCCVNCVMGYLKQEEAQSMEF